MTELKYLFLQNNKVEDLGVLVDMASKDADKRFAPFWRVFLKGNPLNDAAKGAQVEALEKSGGKVKLGE